MAIEDLFNNPYWRAFKRDYEMKHGGKIDLNTGKIIPNNSTTESVIPNQQNAVNYEQALKRRPMRQPRQMDIERYGRTMSPRGNTGFVLRGNTPVEYTGQNFILRQEGPLQPGYSRMRYYPSTSVVNQNLPTAPYNIPNNASTYSIPPNANNTISGYGSTGYGQSIFGKPITGYGTTNKAIKGLVPSNSPLLSKIGVAGKFVGPALGIAGAIPEILFGNNATGKALATAGAVAAINPTTAPFSIPLFIGAGLNNHISRPEYQINKSNKDFAKYEEMYGTPDNPNLSNLAPGLKPLSDAEIEMLQFKTNRTNQPQVDSTQLAQATTQEKYQEAANEVVNKTINEQNKLNEMANNLQPQPVQYKANIFGQNVYNATPDLSAATENTIDQMNQSIQNVPNLYQNMFGQGGTEVGSNALASYIQLLGQQQQDKQAMAEQMLAGYQQAAKQDRYQDLINGISDAFQNYNYNRSLVFLPSGFNPNGGQTFTPVHLANAPKERGKQETNVDRYLKELQLNQQLTPDKTTMNEAMTQALQAQALGEATESNPWLYMGNSELAKQMFDKVLGPQISEGAKIRAELAKLSPETYANMVKDLNKTKGDSILKRMEKEYELAGKNIDAFTNTELANASEQNKFFMNHINNYVSLAKQGMSDENAIARLKLTGMNNEQLAILKADLESSNPVKQMNAAAQVMNAFTRFATPQEAQAYQNQIFPKGLPQFTDRRSP